MIYTKAQKLFEHFDSEVCDNCGECFRHCPVLNLSPYRAFKEIIRLKKDGISKNVLKKCTTCFACNLICPNQANPTQLILQKFYHLYKEKGLPIRAKYFQPYEEKNFRTYVLERMPEDEKKLVKSWGNLDPVEEFCYPGCNICTSAYLTKSKIFANIDIRGGIQYCCGETYYRVGLFDELEQIGIRMQNYFKKLKAKKMLILCSAGFNMFTNVLPSFGLHIDLEITPLLVWLWEKIKNGQLKITNKIKMKITIQDSCYGKIFGKDYYEIPRKIADTLGIEVIEAKNTKECSLCCGVGGGFSVYSGYHPFDIAKSTFRCLKQAQNTGAEAILVYCAGCLQMLSTGKILLPFKLPVYHILEFIQMAIGETPLRRQDSRAKLFFYGTLINQFPKLLSNKRYKHPKIKTEI